MKKRIILILASLIVICSSMILPVLASGVSEPTFSNSGRGVNNYILDNTTISYRETNPTFTGFYEDVSFNLDGSNPGFSNSFITEIGYYIDEAPSKWEQILEDVKYEATYYSKGEYDAKYQLTGYRQWYWGVNKSISKQYEILDRIVLNKNYGNALFSLSNMKIDIKNFIANPSREYGIPLNITLIKEGEFDFPSEWIGENKFTNITYKADIQYKIDNEGVRTIENRLIEGNIHCYIFANEISLIFPTIISGETTRDGYTTYQYESVYINNIEFIFQDYFLVGGSTDSRNYTYDYLTITTSELYAPHLYFRGLDSTYDPSNFPLWYDDFIGDNIYQYIDVGSGFVDWISTAIQGFYNFNIGGIVTVGQIMQIIFVIGLVIVIIKMFAGG